MSRAPRFFVPPAAIEGNAVMLPPEDAHHARSVLRLRVGDPLIVLSGGSSACACTLTHVSAAHVVARIESRAPCPAEPRTRITIAQALPKNADKVEQVLRHGTEIGAAAFLMFLSARSVARLEGDRAKHRLQRWHSIVKAAAEQSGREMLPPVEWAGSAREAARQFAGHDAALIAYEAATLPLAHALAGLPPEATRLLVLVGPEGGLTESEVAQFAAADGVPVSLGPRILRTETAALVALAQILFAREEILPPDML